jgi:hypothetical protein
MSTATEMIRTYPAEINLDRDLLARCIDPCVSRAAVCTGVPMPV